MRGRRITFIGIMLGAVGLTGVDQLVKALIVANREHLPITVIEGCFDLRYVENTGVAFGLLQGMGGALIVPSLLSLIVVVALLIGELRSNNPGRLALVALSLVTGGAIGNIIDRVWRGFVVDYIDWYYGSYHWYTFNIADAAISVGVTTLIVGWLFAGHAPSEHTPANEDQTTPE